MQTFNFTKWNKITGWVVFAIALTTYWLTVEPTVSFWDSGEFITTSSNLEVGHPPGAPLFQMIGAFFSIFAPDATYVALTINLMSVFASAFTILFMFWSLTILIGKMVGLHETVDAIRAKAIIGSAAVGSLAFAFTDSFWFNAVEAEVYAMAICLMSILFYLGLRWERDMHTPRGNKWLVLIAFIIGLSFGVHFMALLAIPAIFFLYYFKNVKTVTVSNFIIACIASAAILLFIFIFLLPMTMKFFSSAEVFFVNSVGLPFNGGTIIAALIFIGLFYFFLKYTRKKGYVHANTLVLCILFIFIGFSSWLMLPIRANAGTVINENNPADARELLAYYNREQYPETSLIYGPMFSDTYAGLDPVNPYKDDKPNYERDTVNKKYIIVNNYKNAAQNTDDAHKGLLPRMWSPEHSKNYLEFTGGLDFTIKQEYLDERGLVEQVNLFKNAYRQGRVDTEELHKFLKEFGDILNIKPPSLMQNLRFMFEYQFGYMYWRYFMWNFTGRQDDIQGRYDDLHGNWISGIKFIDEMLVGNQNDLPSDVKNNKGRNTYFFLPFILGIIGLVFHFKNDRNNWWVLMVFFLFTGIALKIYLNERPFEPRERDYALVGSFYVFGMWIAYGVYALFDFLKKHLKPQAALPVVLVVTSFAAPVLLATQNWDDHDRSHRYTARSMAKMYLDSCDENAIIFTIGDNDTFALWYAQNVEGYRRDVRVVNTSLFQTDWYIDDMKRQAFTSAPIPSQLVHNQYRWGTRDFLIHNQRISIDTLDIADWMRFVADDTDRTTITWENGQVIHTFPTKVIRIPVDKESVLKHGIVPQKDADKIVDEIFINLKSNVIYKNRLLMLDIIANNNWERPIYFSGGSFGDDDYLWMKDYLQLEGTVYKLVPIYTPIDKRNPFDMGRIDADKMYDIVMGWDWGNGESPKIYHDPETRKNAITYRSNLARLAETLLNEEKKDKAEKIIDLAVEKMPVKYYGYYSLLEPFVLGYYELEKDEKARALYEEVRDIYREHLNWFNGFKFNRQRNIAEEIISTVERYRSLVRIVVIYDSEEYGREEVKRFNDYIRMFRHFYNADEGLDYQDDDSPTETHELLDLDSAIIKELEEQMEQHRMRETENP
ncbi:MAG TPA: DUF2723 domain-containing protein [Flavobacteriaceae bacterium]|nr:DUF2723 domain-containing protein [Flavobacteriaceae bacterium]